MRVRVSIAAFLTAVLGATLAYAQNITIIKERKGHYEAMGKSVKEPNGMFKGTAKFDLAKVQAALKTMQEKAAILPKLFPDDSKTGADTEALAPIWENKADFEAKFKKFSDDAKNGESMITDEASFKTEWPVVMGNCSGCHKKYRKEKK